MLKTLTPLSVVGLILDDAGTAVLLLIRLSMNDTKSDRVLNPFASKLRA